MKMKNKFVILLFTSLISLALNGCAIAILGGAAAAGAGGYAWYSGELKSSESVAYDKAIVGVQAAMKQMGYTTTVTEKSGLRTKLTFRGSGDERVVITVNKISDSVSEIGVRVGTFGDQTRSVHIMDSIRNKL
jgi:hypothetical protein